MAIDKSDRTSNWPAIEKKYGEPMSYWFEQMAKLADAKYPEQIAHLRENFGFSQAHANAVVMFCRGSASTKKFSSFDDYFKKYDATKVKLAKDIFKAIKSKYPKAEEVIAWNQPMIKIGDDYIFGLNILTNYLLIAPHDGRQILLDMAPQLKGLEVKQKTVVIPLDWKVDAKLIQDMAARRIAAVSAPAKKVAKTAVKTPAKKTMSSKPVLKKSAATKKPAAKKSSAKSAK